MVPVGGPGARCGGSGGSGGSLPLLDLEVFSGVSGMKVAGSGCSVCSLDSALVAVGLPKTHTMQDACHLLVVGHSGGRSVPKFAVLLLWLLHIPQAAGFLFK